MIVDFHTHIFPAECCCNRERFFPSEPEFELLYCSSKANLIGAEELIRVMDAEGVDRSVVFGFPWKMAETFERHNDYIVDSVRLFPDRLIGFGCFDPFHPDAPAEARRCLDRGLGGIGELAFYQAGIDEEALEKLAPIMELCRQGNMPVLIHTNEPIGHRYPGKTPNTLAEIYRMIQAFPDNRIVLAHWGGGIFFFQLLKKEVKACLKNVFYDTAASPYLYDPEVYQAAVQLAGKDKILFGSDYPLIKPSRYIKELSETGLSENIINGICGENAARLLGIRQ